MMIFEGLIFSFVGLDINLLKDTSVIVKEHGGEIFRPPAACFGPSILKANYIVTGKTTTTTTTTTTTNAITIIRYKGHK